MNTPAHLILGSAVFARPDAYKVNVATLTGAFLPDASLYFMFFWHSLVLGTSERIIFDQIYFSPFWQQVFAIDNSVFVWAGLLWIAFLSGRLWAIAFAVSGLLHLALDFPLHHDDGRAHFWPVSDWIFESPVSYWDPQAHGQIMGGIELVLCFALLVVLWRRFSELPARLMIGLAATTILAPPILFALMLG